MRLLCTHSGAGAGLPHKPERLQIPLRTAEPQISPNRSSSADAPQAALGQARPVRSTRVKPRQLPTRYLEGSAPGSNHAAIWLSPQSVKSLVRAQGRAGERTPDLRTEQRTVQPV